MLDAIKPGDALVATALDWLGRDTLGLLEPINRLATMTVDLRMLDMPVDAQGQGVSESLVRRVLMVEDVEAIAFKNGWD